MLNVVYDPCGFTNRTKDQPGHSIPERNSTGCTGADGVMFWGADFMNMSSDGPPVVLPTQTRKARLAEYRKWVPDVLGRVVAQFKKEVAACSAARCGGHGRCGSLADESTGCVCYDGYDGAGCAGRAGGIAKKTDDGDTAVGWVPSHLRYMGMYVCTHTGFPLPPGAPRLTNCLDSDLAGARDSRRALRGCFV